MPCLQVEIEHEGMASQGAAGARADTGESQPASRSGCYDSMLASSRTSAPFGKRDRHEYMAIAPLPSLAEPDSLCLALQDYPLPSALALPGHWSSFAQAHRSDSQIDTAQSWRCVNPQMDCTKL